MVQQNFITVPFCELRPGLKLYARTGQYPSAVVKAVTHYDATITLCTKDGEEIGDTTLHRACAGGWVWSKYPYVPPEGEGHVQADN